MQKDNKIFDDLARMATGAAGNLLEMKREMEAMVSQQLERLLAKMDLATKEEIDTVQGMLAKFRSEQEEIKKRLEALEKKLDKK